MLGKKLDEKIKEALMKNKLDASKEVGVPKSFLNSTGKFPQTFNPSKSSVDSLKSESSNNKVEFAGDYGVSDSAGKNSVSTSQSATSAASAFKNSTASAYNSSTASNFKNSAALGVSGTNSGAKASSSSAFNSSMTPSFKNSTSSKSSKSAISKEKEKYIIDNQNKIM